jgi:osmotically-inducible protein OsmY
MTKNHGGRRVPQMVEERPIGLSKDAITVQAEAQLRLRRSGYRDLHSISCEFHEGVLTLRGRVSTFYLKQLAQTLIRELDDVAEINNRLEVVVPLGSP